MVGKCGFDTGLSCENDGGEENGKDDGDPYTAYDGEQPLSDLADGFEGGVLNILVLLDLTLQRKR